MRLNSTMAARKITDIIGPSFMLNRDPAAVAGARCQVWRETEGRYDLLATGRTWEDAINHLLRKSGN